MVAPLFGQSRLENVCKIAGETEMKFSQILSGAAGVLAVALPSIVLFGAHFGTPSLSAGLVTTCYVIGGIACALCVGLVAVFTTREEIEKPLFSLMGAAAVSLSLLTADSMKDNPGLWWTLFIMGALILAWRGLKWFIHTPLFEIVLEPGVNFVPSAETLSADQKFKAAERMFRKLALPAGYGRTGMDYFSRGRVEHRYGKDGMPASDVPEFVEAAQRSGMTRSTHLVILVRNVPDIKNEPAVIIAGRGEMEHVTQEGDGIRVLSHIIPAQDIAGVVFYGWLGQDG